MFKLTSPTKIGIALCTFVLLGTSWVSLRESYWSERVDDSTKIDKLKLLPGFKAEHLYSPSANQQGSWVAMAFDDKGRMITSDQYGFLYRLQLPTIGSGVQRPNVEKLKVSEVPGDTTIGMGYAQGLLYAFNSLYVMVNNRENKNFGKGSGLYRLQDTNGDDQFDKITLIKALKGEGEHGPHSLVLSPDKKSIYLMCGNFTDVPKMDAYRLPPVWKEDNLFPAIKDPRGHAVDRMAPGGWIAKIDPEGKNWEFVGGGFRNTFDFAFNDAGDIFGYDSDMEWDFGLPWYKPTRICHITSGADFGWRTSATNWSPTFADCLPATLNMGQGSPTGVFAGRGARFPQKYQKAIYAFDWSFGIMYAVHLQPQGASYKATAQEFISGSPLPLTDGQIGPDGALYFLTGGRRLESDLYRITYAGTEATAPDTKAPVITAEHQIRTKLEQYHGAPMADAVNTAWPYLNHPDRFIRYAARVAVEHQPVAEWQAKALAETDPQRLTQAMIALAHHGDASLKSQMLTSLLNVKLNTLAEQQQADVLRAIELVCTRMGLPEGTDRAKAIAVLSPRYPAGSAMLNRAYSKLLISLEAPGAVDKTLKLLALNNEDNGPVGGETVTASSDLILRNPQYGLDIAKMLAKVPPAQQTYYATMLSSAKTGWTSQLRDQYFAWFAKAFGYQGGNSYVGYVDKARKLALANVPKEQFEKYNKLSGADLLTKSGNDIASDYTPKGPYRNWKLENAVAVVDSGLTGRSYETGKKLYGAILCSRCHSMGGQGGDIGPDLTQLGTRFSNKDILEAIIYPDKTVSDQYASSIFTLKNGQSVLGRLINEDKANYFISQNPFASDQLRKVAKKDVVSRKYSPSSIMLPGLINSLNPGELKDLIAYLKSGGNQANELYKTSDTGKGK
ncbi:c-type cytochrome [Fibrella forsythiae]|uniref:C-type cytochrome n=1 Tax=Fibrella forsythiae TaxID=2817061 RepID=A0ABS3JS29_9BACT|nr:c-type cytochrome [Fibrella forsythiae]MBO0952809.1 c-type cytochrome [Fibrella forsythiae]